MSKLNYTYFLGMKPLKNEELDKQLLEQDIEFAKGKIKEYRDEVKKLEEKIRKRASVNNDCVYYLDRIRKAELNNTRPTNSLLELFEYIYRDDVKLSYEADDIIREILGIEDGDERQATIDKVNDIKEKIPYAIRNFIKQNITKQ